MQACAPRMTNGSRARAHIRPYDFRIRRDHRPAVEQDENRNRFFRFGHDPHRVRVQGKLLSKESDKVRPTARSVRAIARITGWQWSVVELPVRVDADVMSIIS